MKIRSILSGILSYAPFFQTLHRWNLKRWSLEHRSTGSTRYCYSVWLRHLSIAHEYGLSAQPDVIAELGPGDSLGVGLAGLISGANEYYAFDVVKYSTMERNVETFDELVEFFRAREDIPDETEFPQVRPCLKSYDFPYHILTDAHLDACLRPDRIRAIRDTLLSYENNLPCEGSTSVKYFVPWYDSGVLRKESVDMVFSQAVLEHVENLDSVYKALYHWLKPGGYMSHQVDFRCHGTADRWNGHWAYSDFMWKVMIRGRRPYLINRAPHSVHINLQRKNGFEILADVKVQSATGIDRRLLAPRFKHISNDDLTTSTAHILSAKNLGTVSRFRAEQ